MLGWTVLNNLKFDPATRHIPVQIFTVDEERQSVLARGAFSYLVKSPTTKGIQSSLERLKEFTAPRTKRLLVVEDNEIECQAIVELLDAKDIELTAVSSGGEAIEALLDSFTTASCSTYGCPTSAASSCWRRFRAEPALQDVPVVVFTGKELSYEDEVRLKTMAKSIVLKDVQSPERLLDETALFLHRIVADLPLEKQKLLERLHVSNEILHGRKVLVVDDDARNIFALTSLLESQEIDVISATNGRQAIDLIQSTPDLSMVLMDIMMPEMDGYQTIERDSQASLSSGPCRSWL